MALDAPGGPAATKAANAAVLTTLPFGDKEDFADATRGLIAKPDTLTIKDAHGTVVWDLEAFKSFIGVDKPSPDTVNPSLWRHAQLHMQYGLFKVDVLPALKDGASTAVFPSPIEGSGTTWV